MSGYKAYKPGEHKNWLISESRESFILVDKKLKLNIYVIKKSTGCVYSENRLGFIESIRLRLKLRQKI